MQSLKMQDKYNSVVNLYQTQYDTTHRLTNTLMNGVQKIDHVLLEISHRSWTDQLRYLQSLLVMRDAQSAASEQAKYFSQRMEHIASDQRELLRTCADMQTEINKSICNYMEQWQRGAALDFFGKLEPEVEVIGRHSNVTNPLVNLFTTWQVAFQDAMTVVNSNAESAPPMYENGSSKAHANGAEIHDVHDEMIESVNTANDKQSVTHHKRK